MKFSEVQVGQKFKVNDRLYEKIGDRRINCCTVHNAKPDGGSDTLAIDGNAEVELVTE
jgi:hypothetical protein